MNELGDLFNKLGGVQGGADTTKQIFGVIDDISSNFEEKFQSAKANQDSKEKVTPQEKKDPSAPEKVEKEESAKRKLIEQDQRAQKEITQEGLTNENRVESDRSTEIEQAESSQVKAEESTQEIVDGEGVEEEIESPEAAAISSSNQAEKATQQSEQITEESREKQQVKQPQKSGQQVLAEEEKGAEPAPLRDNQPKELAEAMKEEREERGPLIDSKEQKKMALDLKKISDNSQVQLPVAEKVSEKILDSLKSTNQQLAKQISSAKGQESIGQQGAYNSKGIKAGGAEIAKGAEKGSKPSSESRLDNLKAKVLDQVRVKIKTLPNQKGGSIKIQLKPQWLGNVKIQINFEDTTASGNLLVENNTVKEMLQRNLPHLQKALAEHGIDAENLEVNVDENLQGDGENGRAFQSAEDQKAARQWLGSFHRFGEATAIDQKDSENISEDEMNSEQVLNVVV